MAPYNGTTSLDLTTVLGSNLESLPTIDGEQVRKCLALLAKFMNDILGYFTTIHFDFVLHISPAPQNIVYGLKKFLEWEPIISELERMRILGDDP